MKRKGLIIAAVVVLVPAVATWWAATQLAHPSRRPLQNFHREFIRYPTAHGVELRSFVCADGTPCLVCEPESSGALGKRGVLIRTQLQAKGLVLPPPGAIAGNLVLVHGRRGRKEDYLLIAERLCAAGFRCILPDLPAHGAHPGETAFYGVKEWPLPAMVLGEAAARFDFEEQPAGIMGISMGGAVGIRSAARSDAPWRAAVFLSTFDTLGEVVQHQAASLIGERAGSLWRKSTEWLYEQEAGMPVSAADSLALVPSLKCPTLIAHGTSDRVIPLRCGERLFAALPAGLEKRWIEIPGADHDNVLITDFPIYAEMAKWMLRHVRN